MQKISPEVLESPRYLINLFVLFYVDCPKRKEYISLFQRNRCLHIPWLIMDALYLLLSLAGIGYFLYLAGTIGINNTSVGAFVFHVIIAFVYLGLYPK